MKKIMLIAAVGNDGLRPVVWGIGDTEARARADARLWLDDDDDVIGLAYHRITLAQARVVRAGDVSWPITASEVQS